MERSRFLTSAVRQVTITLYLSSAPLRTRCEDAVLLVRNSWGEFWGAGGYGWLPMDYLIAYALQAVVVTT